MMKSIIMAALLVGAMTAQAQAFQPCSLTFNPAAAERNSLMLHRNEASAAAQAASDRAREQAKLDACMRDFNKSVKPPK
jgi:hypothetical protein